MAFYGFLVLSPAALVLNPSDLFKPIILAMQLKLFYTIAFSESTNTDQI